MQHLKIENDMKTLMVFDWNGTLLNDTEAVIYADNCALAHFGGRPIDVETFQNTVSIPKIEFYKLHGCSPAFLNENLGAVADFAGIQYQKMLPRCGLRPGAVEVLKFLKEHEVHVLILSNDMVDNIWSQLRRFKIDTYIDAVLANTDPYVFMRHALKQNRLAEYLRETGPYHPQVIVGDSTEEIIIGKKLGLTTVSLLKGIHSQPRLVSESPDLLSPSLVEALFFLQQVFSDSIMHRLKPR
jgi:phosphoglycolate phosphatase